MIYTTSSKSVSTGVVLAEKRGIDVARTKQAVCKNGHDTSGAGRYDGGNCVRCTRDRRRKDAERNRIARTQHGNVLYARAHGCHCDRCEDAILAAAARRTFLPFEPMLRYRPEVWNTFGVWESSGIMQHEESLERAWYRAQRAGRINVMMADELCIHILRRNPSEVFGSLWFEVDA